VLQYVMRHTDFMTNIPSTILSSKLGQVRRYVRVLAVVCAISTLGLGVASCSSGGETLSAAVVSDAIVIDVRTPTEYLTARLDGALLYDIQNPNFTARLAELDPTASYIVYCRSGNRSAAAIKQMKAAGFTNLVDLGSLENAASKTGIAIVQG
jgi:phage shock protein E